MSDQPKDIGELLKPVYDLQDRRTAEAVERFKAEAWERAQVKYPCVADLGELLADDAHSTPCPACALKAIAEVLGIEVTG